ncbi:MAG: glycosyltransferase family 4 protein [Nitrospinota bacterium]
MGVKVLHIVEDMEIGGLERVIEGIVLNLDRTRFDAGVLCLTKGGAIAGNIIAKGGDAEIIGIRNYHSPVSIKKVVERLKKKKTSIVHTHGYPAGVLGRVSAIIAGIPHIYHHVHSTYWGFGWRQCLMENILARYTRKVICCSVAVKGFMTGFAGIREDKVVVIYNGVPELDPVRTAGDGFKEMLGIPRDARIIGTVASIVPHKGHKYLIEAFKGIEQQIPGTYLVIVGNGPLRKEIEELADKYDILKRIRFTGKQSDIYPYLSMMDIFVLPSVEREGLGLALIEAMSMEKPVIATDIGGIPEVVEDGKSGILVRPGDCEGLMKAIISIMNNIQAKNMGKRGREIYLEKFTISTMIKGIEGLYSECTG